MSVAQKAAEARKKKRSSRPCGAGLRPAFDGGKPRAGQRPALHRSLFDSRLYPPGEKSAERTAYGHGWQGLSVPLDRQKRGGEAAGQQDERAESKVRKV